MLAGRSRARWTWDYHTKSFQTQAGRRWLELFEATLAEEACGPFAERAKTLARRIAGNMRRNLEAHRPQS